MNTNNNNPINRQAAPGASFTILKQLAELPDLPTPELKERWRLLYGQEPPRFNRQFLIKRLAYRIQELACGGLPEEAKNWMESILDEEGYDEYGVKQTSPGRARSAPGPIPGTVLLREWNGRTHKVTVLPDGYEYLDIPYRSLSAVARKITGTNWNGPAFFGLRGTGKKGNGKGNKVGGKEE